MTPEQIALVQGSWRQVAAMGDKAIELFYARLFEVEPGLRPLFPDDMAEQHRKLAAMLNAIVGKLERPDELVLMAQSLARRHMHYGVKNEHYAPVGAALLDTLGAGLGDAFTDDVRSAWIAAYTTLSGVMTEAAAA
jgi:hemoglobin-like flavoprotein